ncbi:maleylpyruvate isomerase family mycothiol-dependent enzyme [Nocardiopsis suaedae]|uniref:Maleylpyruvate isomerase family mycothiol-dependent enzyme n=1 Tax=Nocardiopsis suaedae TaxID=3018444 RepID=A0ABT4TFW6_9ACTN|nr:maleylpyruvate isomerase family mycothiol-dependent enzyme [Nocardiopsis suaedae]MDA2803315.1 maleylpyruvate isomerase family mycothiol-dependent enzyme [Nocardiopsis suaedae]
MIDTRPLFPRERGLLVDLLADLDRDEWSAPTVCPGWDVHDVAAHVLHDYTRRLSGGRDGHRGPPFAQGEALADFIHRTNGEFVAVARHFSPELMVDQIAHLGPQLDALWAGTDLDGPADLDIPWASDARPAPAWLDLAREYTEFWVHQQQIRDAVGRPGADGPDLAGPVTDAFTRALPKALAGLERPDGTSVEIEVQGAAGGVWTVAADQGRWGIGRGHAPDPAARVVIAQDDFWRLATRGIGPDEARGRAGGGGDAGLWEAATALVAVIR